MADRTRALRAAVTQAERFLDTLDERRVGAPADASASATSRSPIATFMPARWSARAVA